MTKRPGQAAPAPHRKRSRWARLVLVPVAVLAGLVLALHLPVVQRQLTPWLQRALSAAAGGTVAVGSLEFNIFTGRVHGSDLRLVRPGLEFTAASLDVQARPWRGVVVSVTEPRVVVSLTSDGAPAATDQRPWTALERVAAIEVVRGAIRVQRNDRSPVLEIAGLGVRATREGSALRAAVVAESITVPRPGHESLAVTDARLDLEVPNATQALHVRSAKATVGDALVRATGDLEQLNPIVGRAHVEVPAGMTLVRTFAPDAALEGDVAVRVEVVADRSGYRASFAGDATAVRLAHVGPWDGRVAGHVEGDVLHLDDIDLAAYGGRLQGLGTIPLDGATSHLRVQVRDLDLPHVLRSHASGTPRIASRADADLSLQLTQWDPRTLAANGTVSLRPMTGPGIPVRGSATFSADQQRLRLSAATVRVRDAELRVNGTVGFDGRVSLRYGASLADASRLADMLGRVGVDMPPVNVTGTLAVEGTVDGPLDRWAATARFSGRRLAIEGVDLDVDSELRVTPTSLQLVHFTADGPDGVVSASGEIPMGRGTPALKRRRSIETGPRSNEQWHIVGSLEQLRFDDALARHDVPLGAIAHGRFEVTGPRNAPEMAITLAADVSSRAAGATDAPAAMVLVEASARVSSRGVVVEAFRAHNGAGAVEGTGRWAAGSGEVDARVRSSEFPLAAIPGLPPLPDLASVVTGDLEISGTLPALTGRGSVTATRTVWRGAAFPDLRIDLASDGREVTLAGSLAQQPLLTGRMPLVTPWPLHVDIDLAALPLDEVMRAFPALAKRDASATFSGRALVDVELASPSQVRYEAHVDHAEGSLTQPWKMTPFTVRGTLDDVAVQDLEVQFDFGRLRVDGQVGLAHDAPGRLTVSGAAPLLYLALLTPIEEADGEALVDVTLAGSISRPSLVGTVRVTNGLIRQGALRLNALELVAALDKSGVEVRQASARIAGGQVYGTAALALAEGPSNRYRLELHGRGIDVGQLVPARDDQPGITAVVDADVRAASDRLSLDAIQAEGSLKSLAISVAGRTFGVEGPVAVSLRAGTLTHAPLRLVGTAGHVTLESSAAFVDGQPQLTVGINGEVDLAVAGPLLGDSGTLAGLARVDGRVEWDAAGWHAHGEARVNGGRVALTDPAIVLSDVAATLRGQGDRIEVVEGSGRVGDGQISVVTGRLLLSSDGPDIDLVLRADRVPLEYPTGIRTRSSGNLQLTGRSGAYRVAGDIVVHRAVAEMEDARATPGIDRVSAALTAFTGRGSLRDRTALDLRVRLDDGLRIATPLISLVVDGAVRVGGTLLTPEISGSFTFREGGTVRVSRALIRLEAGQVELSGYPARQPEVDVQGTTQVSGVGIDVSLSGPLDDVRMTLSSQNRSDLGQGDLATLILTGRTTSAAASQSGTIVAEELASSLGRVINRQLGGLVMFDVSQDESLVTENTNSSLQMNVGIPLGNRLYVIYSRGLDTGTQRWIVDVRPGRDFRLRVISNDDGSESVEASHRFGFDLWSRRSRPTTEVRVRPRIRSVTVVGASPGEEAKLRSKLRLAPGDEFDFFRVLDAARDAQAWLVAQGFLEAAVEADHETTTGGSVDLTVRVARGPLVRIEWRGDDPGGAVRKRVIAGWNSILPRDERAARLARDVRRTLQASRFYAAVVTATVSDVTAAGDEGAGEVRVTFDVARGERGAGVDLRFEGNTSVSDATLAASLPPTNTAAFFALLEPEASRRLAAALRVAYATEGFLDMRTGNPSESFGGRGERLNVTIPVVEGERASLVALDLPEEVRAAGDPLPVLALREGAPFRLDAYTADRARLLTWLRNEGYPDARLTSALEPMPGGLAVRFYADAGPRVTMGTLRTARDGRTRPSVIEHAVSTSPGDVIRASSLDDARRQLIDTRVFRSVDLRLEPVDGREDVRDIVVDVIERRDVNVEYSLRYTTAGQAQVGGAPSQTEPGLQAGAGVELVSPFGVADRYRFSGLVGGERLLLNARYDRSTFFKWPVPTAVVLYDDRTRLAETQGITQRVKAANFEQTRSWRNSLDGRRLHERVRVKWGYTLRQIDYVAPTFAFSDETLTGLRAGLFYSLIGDTRDSLTDPHRGTMSALSGEFALVGLGSDVNYIKTFGQVFVYVPLLPHLTWAQGYRIGYVPGNDPLLLLDGRFFAGGASSVRGFAEASLGPRSLEGEPLGGQASAILNQELRFPIWNRLHGGIFYDAGNVFALGRQLDLFDLRQSAGVGLRLMFPFGPVRLEWAHVIDPRPGEQPSRVVFSIGHAF